MKKTVFIICCVLVFAIFHQISFAQWEECPLMVGEQYYKSVIVRFNEGYVIDFGNCKLKWVKNSIGDLQVLNIIKCDTKYIVSIPIGNILYIEKYLWDNLIY